MKRPWPTVGCLRQMGQRVSPEDREWNGLPTIEPSEALAAEAKEDGSWWSAEESRLIKMPTTRIPVFDCWRTIVFGRGEKRQQKTGKNYKASE